MGTRRPEFSGKVSAEFLEKGVWLSQAAEAFGDKSLVERLTDASDRFITESEGQSPLAYLRSTSLKGGERRRMLRSKLCAPLLQPWDEWNVARISLHVELNRKLRSGELLAFGAPQLPDAVPVWIGVQAWYQISLDLDDLQIDKKDQAGGAGFNYWYVRVINPALAASGAASRGTETPDQETVTQWMIAYYKQAKRKNKKRPPPKRDEEAFRDCQKAIGATHAQMREAMRHVPPDLKRRRGRLLGKI